MIRAKSGKLGKDHACLLTDLKEVLMRTKGFTLIELLIVVAIIGIIASIAIPNLMIALQKSRQKVTMGDLKSVGIGIESYITDWTVAPTSNPTLDGVTWFEPFYIKVCPKHDGWGHRFGYVPGTTAAPDDYSIWSGGRGGPQVPVGNPTIPVPAQYICRVLLDFTNDICFSDGYFTVGPDTKR